MLKKQFSNITMDTIDIDLYEPNKLLKMFDSTVKKLPFNRNRLDISIKCKCNIDKCLKFASYNYKAEGINVCWFHAYQINT